MPRKGENIYKRKDGRWEGRFIKGYKPDGKASYGYVYGYTYREAKEKLNLAAIDKKNLPVDKKDTAVFADLSQQWLLSQKTRVKESTFNKYSNLLALYILPRMGSIRVDKISYGDISGLCDELLRSGGKRNLGLSPKTVSDAMSVIKNIMRYALQSGYHPSFDIQLLRVKQPARELRILSQTEQNKLYAYLTRDPSTYDIGILICLLTGLRIGEVCALRWEDISFADHMISVHGTMQRIQDKADTGLKTKVVITAPKSVSGKRIIPIPRNLEQILKDMNCRKRGFVLSADGKAYTEPRVLQYRFQKIIQMLGIQQINFHALRHTFATRCIEVGFDVKSLSEILGHSSVSITMNRYVHPSFDLKRENMQRLSAAFAVK